jgi:hypothetical protein
MIATWTVVEKQSRRTGKRALRRRKVVWVEVGGEATPNEGFVQRNLVLPAWHFLVQRPSLTTGIVYIAQYIRDQLE